MEHRKDQHPPSDELLQRFSKAFRILEQSNPPTASSQLSAAEIDNQDKTG